MEEGKKITLRLDDDLARALEQMAKLYGFSQSDLIRLAILLYC